MHTSISRKSPATNGYSRHFNDLKASEPASTSTATSPTLSTSSPREGSPALDCTPDMASVLEEMHLLHSDVGFESVERAKDHELRNAPLLTREAYVSSHQDVANMQYGVLGKTLSIRDKTHHLTIRDPRLYVNTNAPFSAVVCGVQGSGKSHTVAVLLENMLISSYRQIGTLRRPLSGLVLHFGEGGPNALPCEAAWVGVPTTKGVQTPKVRVYVSRSSLQTMRTVYAPLGEHVTVEPLLFTEEELDAQAFLSMMGVGSSESAPLYMQGILSILRDLGENFTYMEFMARLDVKKESFNISQLSGLEQRMALLESFMNRKVQSSSRFAAAQLTIIDLSDPFIDPGAACSIFEIITRLFVRSKVNTGKVLVVDEAHKYLGTRGGASGLTKSLLTLTREQRHYGMRVIISTQEPTVVPPVLLDLCTVSILHRFSSPAWWDHLTRHVSADLSEEDAFDKVVRLQTGEALVLAPSGFGVFPSIPSEPKTVLTNDAKLDQFGRRYLVMKTRKRITADGGASILVVDG